MSSMFLKHLNRKKLRVLEVSYKIKIFVVSDN